jgi:hypothetical protein
MGVPSHAASRSTVTNKLMSMKVRAFIHHIARGFGRTPYWDVGT